MMVDDQFNQLTGQVVAERFLVEGLIAHGGMGSVYRAEQRPLGRQVALKVLRADFTDAGERHMQRLMHEAAATAKLKHPSIVTVYDFGTYKPGHYYLAMEYVDGPNLGALVTKEGALLPDRARRLMLQVARAIRTAHAAGLIHRDLKPGNILITHDEEGEELAKVVDFGLAKDLTGDQELTEHGSLLGSPKYMPPEQAELPEVDHRADIYSFGVTFYAALVGRVPYQGATHFETIRMHREEPIPPLRRDDGVEVPAALEELIRWCMAKRPEERPQSMDEVVATLRRLGTSEVSLSLELPVGMETDDETEIARPFEERQYTPPPAHVHPLGPDDGKASISLAGAWKRAANAGAPAPTPLVGQAPMPADRRADETPASPRPTPSHDDSKIRLAVAAAGGLLVLALVGLVAWRIVRRESRRPDTPLPSASVADTAPAPRATVHVQIGSDPSGAEVFLGTRSLGLTPLDTEVELTDEEASVQLVKRGYWPESVSLADGDVSAIVPLRAR